MNGRVERSGGMDTLMAEALTKIKISLKVSQGGNWKKI
jgi:hypothetical protein